MTTGTYFVTASFESRTVGYGTSERISGSFTGTLVLSNPDAKGTPTLVTFVMESCQGVISCFTGRDPNFDSKGQAADPVWYKDTGGVFITVFNRQASQIWFDGTPENQRVGHFRFNAEAEVFGTFTAHRQ